MNAADAGLICISLFCVVGPMNACMSASDNFGGIVMKRLFMLAALGLCTSVFAQGSITNSMSHDVSTSSNTSSHAVGSVILDNQSSVTSSTTTDSTGNTSHSIAGRTGSMCSAVHKGQRCEISCQAPQVAQCTKDDNAPGPACVCR